MALEVLEDHLVEDREISQETFMNILPAINRKHSVSIETSSVELLQDLQLRIEQSRHLSEEQKEKYIKEIHSLTQEFDEGKNSNTIKDREFVHNLKKNIREGNKEKAIEKIELLAKKEPRNEDSKDFLDLLFEKFWFNVLMTLIFTATFLSGF